MDNTNPTVPGAAPAPAPTPVAPTTPVVNQAPAAPVAGQAPAAPKKKSKVGLIVTLIIVAVLLIGGAIAAIIFYNIHESPENAISDGFTKFLTAGEEKVSGTLTAKNGGNDVKIEFNLSGKEDAYSGSGKLEVEADGIAINAGVEMAVDGEGNIYFRLADKGNIDEVLKNQLSNLSYSMDSSSAEILSGILGGVVDEIDGTWYKIPADMQSGSVKNPMSCIVEKSKALRSDDTAKKVKEAFKEHPFLKAKDGAEVKSKDGYKLYTIEVDEEESKEFSKALDEIDAYKELSKCVESSSSILNSYDSDDYGYDLELDSDFDSEYDLDEGFDSEDIVAEPETGFKFKGDMQLGVSAWSHELKYISLTSEENDTTTNLEMNIEYKVDDVNIPSDAKDIKDLTKDIMSVVSESYSKTMISTYCTEEFEYAGRGSKEACESYIKQMMQEQFGGSDVDITDLIQNFSVVDTSGSSTLMGNIGGFAK